MGVITAEVELNDIDLPIYQTCFVSGARFPELQDHARTIYTNKGGSYTSLAFAETVCTLVFSKIALRKEMNTRHAVQIGSEFLKG